VKIVSFNVNSIRARLHQLERLVEHYQPDVIGLQETKCQDSDFPEQAVRGLGYQAVFHGQKGHYGVALLSRQPPLEVQRGFPWDAADAQRRFIAASYATAEGSCRILNGYFPQGANRDHPTKFPAKQRFYQALQRYLVEQCKPDQQLLVIGDFNVAPEDADVGLGRANAQRWLRAGNCSFLPEERAWFERLQAWGLTDTYRHHHPDRVDGLSWFDYRSRGFEAEPPRGLRIDGILATRSLLAQCRDAGIADDIRAMEKPSDHCPVWAEFGPL